MSVLSILPPFGSPGGKYRKSAEIVAILPEHRVYVEPYAGSAAVLYRKEISEVEVINDLDKEIAFAHEFIKHITPEQIEKLRKRNWISSRARFEKLRDSKPKDDIERIYRFLYLKHASWSGTHDANATYAPSTSGEYIGSCLDRLELAALRLNGVEILCKPAFEVIRKYDSSNTLFYLDPPYEESWNKFYGLSDFSFEDLVSVLKRIKGKFVLSCADAKEARELLKEYCIRKLKFRRTLHLSSAPAYFDYELLVANYELPTRIDKAAIDDFLLSLELPEELKREFRDYAIMHSDGGDFDELAELLPGAKLRKLYSVWASEKDKRSFFLPSGDEIRKGVRQLFGMPGGKRRLAPVIAKIISGQKHETYVEPFAGGAAVFFAKELSEKEVLADIDEDIVFAYKFVKNLTDDQLERLSKFKWTADEKYFYELRDKPRPQDPVERFHWYIYIKRFSYGAGKNGRQSWTFDMGVYGKRSETNAISLIKRLPKLKERLADTTIIRADYRHTIEKYDSPDALFYLDPPYPGEEVDGTEIEPQEFYDAVKAIKGKWLVSLNDSPEHRAAFKNYNICEVHVGRRMDSGSERGAMRDVELLIANFDLPEKIIKVAGEKLETGEKELTREEQRQLLEEEIGDWYLVGQPPNKQFDFVIQYHVRGIWSKEAVKRVREGLKEAKDQKDLELIWRENDCVYLKSSLDELSKAAQQVDDKRGDVTKAIRQHLDDKPPKLGELDISRVYNIGNIHVDWRNEAPGENYLIGMTNDCVKVVLQNLDDELYFPLRDRVLENQAGDQWLSQKKNPQPLSWLTLTTRERPIWEAEPERVGATKKTAGRFILKARGKVVYGVRKSDYHEYFFKFEEVYERNSQKRRPKGEIEKLSGRWDWKLIPSRKEYTKAPETQFWMGSKPWRTQKPYILTHSREEEERKAKRDKIEMIWNEDALVALQKFGFPVDLEKGFRIPILKLIPKKRIAIGPLLIPNKKDLQGDIVLPEDVEEAAWRSMMNNCEIRIMHSDKKINAVRVESYIYRKFDNVPEGTWIGAVKVYDDEVWRKIESGEYRGFSIGGTGTRHKAV